MTKIKIETYGCSANQADSESMAYLLKKANYELTDSENFDLIILNTCTVKTPTENKILRRIKNLRKENKKIIVAGCIPQAEPDYIKSKFKDLSILGVFDISDVVECVEKTLSGKRAVILSSSSKKKIGLVRIRKNPIIEIIPISEGCLGNCAYCKTKQARKNLFSFPISEIVHQAKQAIKTGAKEIWITSQDTGCYGFDQGHTLPELLSELVNLSGDFKIRVGMMNPNHVLKILHDLIKIYKHPKIFKFLHIPVQSGADDILKSMIRNYSVQDFKYIVREFQKHIPNLTISTDIIVGFPGESKKTFNQTLNLINWLKPDVLNISRYWERPGTLSASMDKKLHTRDTKELSRKLLPIFNKLALEKNQKLIGKSFNVLVDELGKPGTYISRNNFYKPIVIKSEKNLFGKSLNVEITSVTSQYSIAKIQE